eukprot:764058-Hanusia_phi.AAC.1
MFLATHEQVVAPSCIQRRLVDVEETDLVRLQIPRPHLADCARDQQDRLGWDPGDVRDCKRRSVSSLRLNKLLTLSNRRDQRLRNVLQAFARLDPPHVDGSVGPSCRQRAGKFSEASTTFEGPDQQQRGLPARRRRRDLALPPP